MSTRTIKRAARAGRSRALETTLEEKRSGLLRELKDDFRAVRSDGLADRDVVDEAESSEFDMQGDIGFAVLQLKAETLKKIDAALRRIEEGDYGDCAECGGEIAEARLRALPFAVRCRDCEAVHEATHRREHAMAYRGASTPFADSTS